MHCATLSWSPASKHVSGDNWKQPRRRGQTNPPSRHPGPELGVWQTGCIGFHRHITAKSHYFKWSECDAGSAASAAEARKHATNDAKCNRLGWVCIPLAVETYSCWGDEAIKCLDRLAARIATRTARPKSSALYGSRDNI